jgi:branched-chain amino acid transport system ATP-binding protein
MLELRNIITGYGKFRVLQEVSMEVKAGEIVCVVGANGAGKTTIMRVISGIIPIWHGSKHFEGEDISKWSPMKLAQRGIIQIPEGRLIIQELTVSDNLKLGAYASYFKRGKKEFNKDLDWVYELFPILKMRSNQKGGTLSGGEQQMLAIGRGLMGRPKVLMLDEPSLGLAPLFVEGLFDTIVKLNKDGIPILLVEQNVRDALEISHRGYILETGAVVMQGPCTELLKDKKITKAYLGA